MGCTAPTPAAELNTEALAAPGAPASFFDTYRLGGKLGKGGFAQVRILENTGSKGPLAVKIMDLRQQEPDGRMVPCPRFRKEAVEEAGAWRQSGQHTNIVGLRDAFLEHGVCFFVMEMCDQSFQNFLLAGAGEDLTERSYSRIFRELMLGLAHIHGKQVVHRDIKPDNVMVCGGTCKLCDFGLAGVLPLSGAGLTGVFGTAPFMPPEMLNKECYDTAVDVWAMGVMAYAFFYGDFPVVPAKKCSAEMKRVIKEGKILPTFEPKIRSGSKQLPVVSHEARHFVQTLLNRCPKQRLNAPAALELGFLTAGLMAAEKLPSLKSTLAICLKAGVFENRRVDKYDIGLDPLLEKLHRKHTGTSLSHSEAEAPRVKKQCRSTSETSMSTSASRHDGDMSATASSVFSVASSATGTSTGTPNYKTSNMSLGGRHVGGVHSEH